ncbi:hypothetical protein B0H16DRAFT_1475336 [Mycena metata]|uniref:Uncharacterized protein n=1 Tax=Mycena metata TaxID=1033252 RepID=A0AAD7HFF7_9AGAR|nr:hypothetical protein B0H16DRAFT_1475336 [Mycena metata]
MVYARYSPMLHEEKDLRTIVKRRTAPFTPTRGFSASTYNRNSRTALAPSDDDYLELPVFSSDVTLQPSSFPSLSATSPNSGTPVPLIGKYRSDTVKTMRKSIRTCLACAHSQRP